MTAKSERLAVVQEIALPREFPFPYVPEEFSDEEKIILSRFFTNTDRPVFAIHRLPQEVVGALFSRYSRVQGSIRRVFLDEFWASPELGLKNVSEYLVEEGESAVRARKRAEKFYKRVFAGYGDDSIIQMGSVHIGFEFVSQIAAKAIEDQRIGAAYIEKSTRYVDFGTEVDGHYLFVEEPAIMESEFKEEFLLLNWAIFNAYNTHLPKVIEHFRGKYAIEEQLFENPRTGEVFRYEDIPGEVGRRKARRAYENALKAKSFDTIRVFLPTTTVTNLGAHFSGQAAENTINKLMASPHPEVRLLGAMAYQELIKVSPSFLQKIGHHHGRKTREYLKETRERQSEVATRRVDEIKEIQQRNRVRLVDWDEDTDVRIASQIYYTAQKGHLSKRAILKWAREVKEEDLKLNPNIWWSPRLAEEIVSAVPDRKAPGLNRRHKLPRAFEHAFAEVEFKVDFGIYRDLQRNRMSSTERQRLSAEEIYVPAEFYEPEMKQVLNDYLRIADWVSHLHRKLLKSGDPELARAAEYVTILGNRLRFNIRANIRQWVFLSELRTIAGGHPTYRNAIQKAVRQILYVMPFLKPLFAHVDWKKDYELGRLKAEVRTQEKLAGREE